MLSAPRAAEGFSQDPLLRMFGREQRSSKARALIRAHPSMPTYPAAETDTEPTTFEPAVCPDCGGRLVVKRVLERQRAGPKISKAHRKVA
jgi:hypothetical protein